MSAKSKSKNESDIEDVQEKLQSIKEREGVIGYILRGSNSASIDLKDPTKIINYAVLSTASFEVGQEMLGVFEIGGVDTILLEGEDAKLFSMVINDHRLSIFMEKSVNHNKLCKDLGLT